MNEAEKRDFEKRHSERLQKVRQKTAAVFGMEESTDPPFTVNSASYVLFGVPKEEIPADYYDNPAAMTVFQEENCYTQMEVDDDFVPYLVPWFGTCVLSSGFGARIQFPLKEDPVSDSRYYPIKDRDDIKNLAVPDPERDGLMPKVLSFIRYMNDHSFLPVGITDCQGPLTTACQLIGYDKLFFLMYDDPPLAHMLMDKISEALIRWVSRQKEETGEAPDECFGDQLVYTGENIGVWMSDDDAVIISPALYREFVVPYNSKVLEAFGGGVVHYCGNASHQIDNLLETEGLRALNVYCLHGIEGVHVLKKKIEGRIVLLLNDYTPLDYEYYFTNLLDGLSRRGLVLFSQFSPIVCMTRDGRYELTDRDYGEKKKIYKYVRGILDG